MCNSELNIIIITIINIIINLVHLILEGLCVTLSCDRVSPRSGDRQHALATQTALHLGKVGTMMIWVVLELKVLR